MNEVTTKSEGDPPAASTAVSVSAAFTIAGQSVSVTSQDITKIAEDGFKFSLAAPVTLGTIDDLLKWINKTFTTDIKVDEATFKNLPDPVGPLAETLWKASLTVEVLNVDTKAGLFEIAIMLVVENPPTILGVLQIDKLGLGVTRIGAPEDTKKVA